LDAYTACLGLKTKLAERNTRIASFEKASSMSTSALTQCALCEGL
jgi:hypothetical protein